MKRILFYIIMAMCMLLPFTASAGQGDVPKAAGIIAKRLDEQIMRRIGDYAGGRSSVSIAITVPVFLGDFGSTSPLARQMAEEITSQLVQLGYDVDEIRKGNDIIMEPGRGEMILTRDINRLETRDVDSAAVLAGTYTVTSESVRFNIKLLHTPNNQVLAMATATVPVTTELMPLLADRSRRPPLPSVMTRLN